MVLDQINPDVVRRALESWQRGNPLPPECQALRAVSQVKVSAPAHSFELYQFFRALVTENLRIQRQIAGVARTPDAARDDPLAALQVDFRAAAESNNKLLRAWSALYYRYIPPLSPKMSALAQVAGYSTKQFRRFVKQGLSLLATTLREVEHGSYRGPSGIMIGNNLPLPEYQRLHAVAIPIRTITKLLLDPNAPPCISIEGLGGIGKTVLAREVARRLKTQKNVVGVLWITARQTMFTIDGSIEAVSDPVRTPHDIVTRVASQLHTAQFTRLGVHAALEHLQPLLSTERYIVVLDQIDAVPNIESLLPKLVQVAGQSCLMLTSRRTLGCSPFVHVYQVPALEIDDAAALVNHELRTGGRLAPLREDDILAIFETAGGLPLALRFVAHQMRRRPLYRILDEIRTGHGDTMRSLYRHVFHDAWCALATPARQLLLSLHAMPHDGVDIDWLRYTSDLPNGVFEQALDALMTHSLVTISGPYDAPRYHCLPLTKAFAGIEGGQCWYTANWSELSPLRDRAS
jgi:hypothetical protein